MHMYANKFLMSPPPLSAWTIFQCKKIAMALTSECSGPSNFIQFVQLPPSHSLTELETFVWWSLQSNKGGQRKSEMGYKHVSVLMHTCITARSPSISFWLKIFVAGVHTYSSSETKGAWWNTLELETNVIVSFFFFPFFFSWPWGWKCFNMTMKYVKVGHCTWKSLKVEIVWNCFYGTCSPSPPWLCCFSVTKSSTER